MSPTGTRVISDCYCRKTATEYDQKTGIKWLSCTEKVTIGYNPNGDLLLEQLADGDGLRDVRAWGGGVTPRSAESRGPTLSLISDPRGCNLHFAGLTQNLGQL
jgi:hypothetical protein